MLRTVDVRPASAPSHIHRLRLERAKACNGLCRELLCFDFDPCKGYFWSVESWAGYQKWLACSHCIFMFRSLFSLA